MIRSILVQNLDDFKDWAVKFKMKIPQWIFDEKLNHLASMAFQYKDKQKSASDSRCHKQLEIVVLEWEIIICLLLIVVVIFCFPFFS